MVELTFDIAEDVIPDDFDIELTDGLGLPAVYNLFTNGGVDITPNLTSEPFTVTNPTKYLFRDKTVVAGFDFTAECQVDTSFDLNGLQVEITWDTAVLELGKY